MIDVKNFNEHNCLNSHKIITNFDDHIEDQTSGYYNRYPILEYLLISDNISELTNIVSSHPSAKIQSKDKIFFSKDSMYPALLLSRLATQYSVDLSRTIIESKATKFIFNKNPIKLYTNSYRWSTIDDIHLTGISGKDRIMCKIPNTKDISRLSFMKSSLEKIYNCTFYYAVSVKNPDTVKLYVDHLNEAVDTRELIKYVNNFIPEASDAEIDTIFSFLKSSDKSIRNTGITLFLTSNVSNNLYKVIKNACELALNNSWAIPGQLNSSWEYFLQYIDCEIDELHYNFNSHQPYFLRKILQNPISTGSMEDIKKEIKILLLKRLSVGEEFKTLREDLKLINCEIVINDKNGETNPSN